MNSVVRPSVWRWSAVTWVAAAAPSGLRSIGLRSFAVWGLLGPMLALSLCVASAGAAEKATAKAKERVVKSEITGEVVATTKRTLSLEIGRTANTSEEMLFPVDPATVKLDRITSLADLQRGDRVRVEYRQTLRETDDGTSQLVGTVATRISLLGRAIGGQPLLRSTSDGGGS